MILIITHKEDFTADFVVNILNERKIEYYRFNCEDCMKEDLCLRFGSKITTRWFDNKTVSSVWFRRTKLPQVNIHDPSEQLYILKEIDAFLNNLLGIIKGKWLSNPIAVREAENKFLQLKIAEEIGFKIPETIISNDKKTIADFYHYHEKIIIKPLNTGRIDYPDNSSKLIFTNVVTEEKMLKLGTTALSPSIFQQYIEKDYELRVTIVGDKIFAAKVLSQSDSETITDWRRKNLKFYPTNLPNEIEKKCKQMMNRLGISFGAFDLIKTPDNNYFFLEINPNGQWVWVEHDTGLKISDAIINYLTC